MKGGKKNSNRMKGEGEEAKAEAEAEEERQGRHRPRTLRCVWQSTWPCRMQGWFSLWLFSLGWRSFYKATGAQFNGQSSVPCPYARSRGPLCPSGLTLSIWASSRLSWPFPLPSSAPQPALSSTPRPPSFASSATAPRLAAEGRVLQAHGMARLLRPLCHCPRTHWPSLCSCHCHTLLFGVRHWSWKSIHLWSRSDSLFNFICSARQ